MTTVLLGTTAAGMISTATCFASCLEQWKNFGSTAARFASVMTFASWTMFERQSRPSLSGSTTSGNRATSLAATFR